METVWLEIWEKCKVMHRDGVRWLGGNYNDDVEVKYELRDGWNSISDSITVHMSRGTTTYKIKSEVSINSELLAARDEGLELPTSRTKKAIYRLVCQTVDGVEFDGSFIRGAPLSAAEKLCAKVCL